jgi:hypothetical protein
VLDFSLFPPQDAIDKATATAGIIKSFFIRMICLLMAMKLSWAY